MHWISFSLIQSHNYISEHLQPLPTWTSGGYCPFFFLWLYSPIQALATCMKISFSLQLLDLRTVALGSTQPLKNWVPGIFLGVKKRPARRADNLAASMSRMSEYVGASTSRNPKGLHGLYGDNYLFTRSTTVGRSPWTRAELVARPLPVRKHRKTHTLHKH
jgi:hypothetical protein